MKVVLASSNPGKLTELSALLAPLGFELLSQAELHLSSAAETGCTFIENALSKARHASRLAAMPAIADDSGIAVDALAGAPGVYSARYAGAGATDAENNNKLLNELVEFKNPAAHYYCAVVYLAHAADPAPLIATGRWDGEIITTPRGENGFGYDPYFLIPALCLTAAELAPEHKNSISHRAQAVTELCRQLHDLQGG